MAEIAGWIGMVLTLLAYVLISFEWVKATSKVYQFMNLFGVIGLGVNVFANHAWPVFFLECIWAGVALVSLVRIYQKK